MSSENKNILICGVGGQGTVLASKVISASALAEGKKVLSAETIGMAQRGGSVTSHVRIGEQVFSPLIPEHGADVMIAFETAEAVRNRAFLKLGATVIVSTTVVQPVTASLSGKVFTAEEMIKHLATTGARIVAVDTEKACREIGSARVVNMVLLGAACREGVCSLEHIETVVQTIVKPQFFDMNKRALEWCGK